jgi:hypothetical protein
MNPRKGRKATAVKAWAWKWANGDVAHFVLGNTPEECREKIEAIGWSREELAGGRPTRVLITELRALRTSGGSRRKGK